MVSLSPPLAPKHLCSSSPSATDTYEHVAALTCGRFKPSFAWVLYRSGYGRKHNQTRVLKVKLPHEVVAEVLGQCACGHGAGGGNGRVQWDPARDLMSSEAGKPRKFLRFAC